MDKIKVYTSNESFEGISVRHALPEDTEFLFELYISGRSDLEFIQLPDDKLKAILYKQQFQSEQQYFNQEYKDIDYHVVLYQDIPVGRLVVHRRAKRFRILAITLIPEYRGKGIGKYLISSILREALAASKQVNLQVAWYNQVARSLYEKLGFSVIEDAGIYCEMQWTPDGLIT